MRKAIVAVLCLIAMFCSGSLQAAKQANYDQSPFGVNAINPMFGRDKPDWDGWSRDASVLKSAGIYWTRFDMWWGVVEPEKDKFDWTYTDKMAKFYEDNGINALPILCYSSAWYRKPPDNDEERARYANYVFHVVDRYKDTFKAWEIWNEPNMPSFWKNPNYQDYTLMLIEAYKAAKKADPTCTILGGVPCGPGEDLFNAIYDNGGWDYFDVMSIHPYSLAGGPITQRFDKELRVLNNMIVRYKKPKSIWITENGYHSARPEEEQQQAIDIFQSYIIALGNGVSKYFYFCFGNYDNWGLIYGSQPLKPKLSFGAYSLMTKYLGSPGPCAPFEGYLKMPEGVACYVFNKGRNARLLILWSNDQEAHTVQLPQTAGLTGIDIFNKPVEVAGGKLSVGPMPFFVTGADARKIGKVSKEFNPFLTKKGENLLINPSMDCEPGKEPRGWNLGRYKHECKDGKLTTTMEGRNGSSCISIAESGGNDAWDASPIMVEEGEKYRVTGWMKTKDATGLNRIAIFWYNGTQHNIVSAVRTDSMTGTNDWTKVTISGVVPKNAALARVNLISYDNKGTVWFDDVELVEE